MKLNLRPFQLQFIFTSCFLLLFCADSVFAQSVNMQMSSSGLKSDIELVSIPLNNERSSFAFLQGKRINPPLPQLNSKRKAIVVDAEKPKKIRLTSGTKIEIPANAFVDEKGELVTGQVDFYYEEYNTGLDILLSGIPMDFKGEHFESAAMFDVRAAQNGKPVFPNQEAPIEIEFPMTPEGDNFSFYNYDEEKGEWVDEGVDELLEPKSSLEDMWGDAFGNNGDWLDSKDYMDRINVIRNPVLVPGGLRVNTLKISSRFSDDHQKGLKFQIKYNHKADHPERLNFEEWKKLNNTYWVYAGDRSRASLRKVKKQMNDLIFEYWPNVKSREKLKNNQVRDVWMIADMKNDCFNLMVARKNDTLSFPVLPYQNGSNELQKQKRIKKMFEQYEERLAERNAVWQEKIADFYGLSVNDLYLRNGGWLSFTGRDINFGGGRSSTETRRKSAPRRVKIKTFGLCNIDTILRLLGDEILVECFTPEGDSLKIKSSYIWNENPRTALNYEGAIIQLPAKTGNRMLLKFKGGKIATIPQEEFLKAYKAKKGNKLRLEVTPIKKKELKNANSLYAAANR